MTRASDIQHLREILQRRRREILEANHGARKELSALKNSDRDPEYEENAQVEHADYTLSTLMENQRREVMLIDAALRRMDVGAFGKCVDCGADISFERLEALPFAIRCEEDARRKEHESRGGRDLTPSL